MECHLRINITTERAPLTCLPGGMQSWIPAIHLIPFPALAATTAAVQQVIQQAFIADPVHIVCTWPSQCLSTAQAAILEKDCSLELEDIHCPNKHETLADVKFWTIKPRKDSSSKKRQSEALRTKQLETQ